MTGVMFGLTLPELVVILVAWCVVMLVCAFLMVAAARCQNGDGEDDEGFGALDGPAAGFDASERAPDAPVVTPAEPVAYLGEAAPPAQPLVHLVQTVQPESGMWDADGLVPVSCLVVTSWGGSWGDLVPVERIVPPVRGCLLN